MSEPEESKSAEPAEDVDQEPKPDELREAQTDHDESFSENIVVPSPQVNPEDE